MGGMYSYIFQYQAYSQPWLVKAIHLR